MDKQNSPAEPSDSALDILAAEANSVLDHLQAELAAAQAENARLLAENAALSQRLQDLQGDPLPITRSPCGIVAIDTDPLDMDQTPYLHDYALDGAHGDALIFGTASALRALVQTIGMALKEGISETCLFDGDGEGYDMHVIRVDDDEAILNLELPYLNPNGAQTGGPDNPYAMHRQLVAQAQAKWKASA